MFNIDVSNTKISELLQDITYKVYEWKNKELDKCYFTINIDCTYIIIRDNKDLNSHKVPIYIVVGTKITGNKEILVIYLGNEDENKNIINDLYKNDIAEATSFWTTIFEDLKERGIEEVFCVVSDGLIDIKTVVKNSFENVFY